MKKTNRMYFNTPDEALKFMAHLFDLDLESKDWLNDIHTYMETRDMYVVEWEQIYKGHDEDYGHFMYVDCYEYIMKQVDLPDGTYDWIQTEEDENDYIKDWLRRNPGWKQDWLGHWYKEDDSENKEIE